jgi:hypothetical protein
VGVIPGRYHAWADLELSSTRASDADTSCSRIFRLRVLYAPRRVVDAPGVVDDYHLDLID